MWLVLQGLPSLSFLTLEEQQFRVKGQRISFSQEFSQVHKKVPSFVPSAQECKEGTGESRLMSSWYYCHIYRTLSLATKALNRIPLILKIIPWITTNGIRSFNLQKRKICSLGRSHGQTLAEQRQAQKQVFWFLVKHSFYYTTLLFKQVK